MNRWKTGLAAVAMTMAASGIGASVAWAQLSLPMGKPEEVGMSGQLLRRIEAVTQKHIDDGVMPGAAMLVARRGRVVWISTLGKTAPGSSEPMKVNTIFRVFSMTRPVISVAIMQLAEEGRLMIGDPISKYLPELGHMKVGTEVTGPDGKPRLELSEPKREITIQDLLRHTSGFILPGREASLFNDAYAREKIGDRSLTLEEMVKRLGNVPLKFSPGDRWEIGVSTDVLGRLVEVMTGEKLSVALNERIFRPLGMEDTSFQVPESKLPRVAQPFPVRSGAAAQAPFQVNDHAAYESGGEGAMSTLVDYLRFTAALNDEGTFRHVHIIGKRTLQFMATDHVGDRPGLPPGTGFGLGFQVRTRIGDTTMPGEIGEYGWSGLTGTLFWIDPKDDLIAIYLVHIDGPERLVLREQFRMMVQAAIIQ